MRLLFAFVFFVLSLIFVNEGSAFYLKYIDKTEYFSVKQPVAVDKNEYEACSPILVDLVRTSTITTRAVSTVELILSNDKGEWLKKTIGGGDFNIDDSSAQIIRIQFLLPCDIASGKYFLKAIVHYEIREINRNYVWESEIFQVVPSSTSSANLTIQEK